MPAAHRSSRTRLQALDLLVTPVAVVDAGGVVRFANAALEDAVGLPSRSIEGTALTHYFADAAAFQHALEGAHGNQFAALRYEAQLRRLGGEPWPVHAIVAQTEAKGELIVELVPLEQQARQEREERAANQARAHKELFRNLAHEIKNPLGGIRGAASCANTRRSSSARPTACSSWWTACWRRTAARRWWAT